MQREWGPVRRARIGRSCRRVPCAIAACIWVGALSAAHAENVYTSTNITDTWSDPAAWVSNTAPTSAIDTELDFGGSGSFGAVFTDDIGTGSFSLNQIQVASTSIATETINPSAPGNSLTFVTNSLSASPKIMQNGSGAYVISNNLVLANTLTIGGTGTGALNLSGAINGAGGLTISSASVVTLGGVNSYTGPTTINSGILSISSLLAEGAGATGLNASGIGQSNNAATNLILNGGALRYTGPTATTDRLFTLGPPGGTLDASGTGAIAFTNTGALAFSTANTAVTLNLSGVNAAANTLRLSIGNNGTAVTSLSKSGAGTWVLSGPNSFSGNVTILAGTLQLADATGSLNTNGNINFTGSGTFVYDNTGATARETQLLNAITFGGGDATVEVNYTSANLNIILFPDHFGARSTGATGNFIVNGGTNGSSSGILENLPEGPINVGTFFNGSAYAFSDSNGFVRAISYTGDTNYGVLTTAGGTSISGSHNYVQTTGNITAQTTNSFTSLNLSGNSNFTLASGATLMVNGLLKSGNVAGGAILSGGAGIEASTGSELVIRTDQTNDALTINTPVLANGSNALTKSGIGSLTFGGINSYTGTTTLNSGTLIFAGSSANSGGGSLIVGGAAGNALLNIATTGTVAFSAPDVGGITGTTSSPSAAGAISQSSATFNYASGAASYLELGTGVLSTGSPGGYGAYTLSGGTLTPNSTATGVRVAAVGLGSFLQSGGNFALGRDLSIGTYGTGVATFTGGTATGSTNFGVTIGDVSGSGTLNLGTQAGGAAMLISQAATGIQLAAGSGTYGTLNLNSGTLLANAGTIHKGSGASGIINFNGGTLQAGASGLTLIDTSPTAVNVYNGGAVIDTQGFTDTLAAPLLATTGNGIYPAGGTLAVSSGGSGYIGPPLVSVSGGSGSGATAIANLSGGAVTGVTLTSPGQNYQPNDVLNFSFAGGGALASAPTFSYSLHLGDMLLNSTGGLTKLGTGTLVLTASNTYLGATNILAGTLQVDGSLANTAVAVSAGATLSGKGAINNSGSNTVSISGAIAPGSPTTDATLTTGPMTWNAGGDYLWKVSQLPTGSSSSGAGTSWDELSVSSLAISSTSSAPFTLTPIGNPPGFSPTQPYTWQIATLPPTGGGITGFTPSNFALNTSQFESGTLPSSAFTVSSDPQDIYFSYTPSPEPSALAMIGIVVFALVPRRRQRSDDYDPRKP
jgi:autotransporter-associated beta strand protein